MEPHAKKPASPAAMAASSSPEPVAAPQRKDPFFYLGASRPIAGRAEQRRTFLPSSHLLTHGVILGMTGSGKTGLLTVLVEEALRSGIPVFAVDIKGDLPNLALPFAPSETPHDAAREAAYAKWKVTAGVREHFRERTHVRILTPGSSAGESLHVTSSLERRSVRWDTDVEAARASLSAAVSLVLRLLGRDPDPAASREHVLLSVLAERRLRAGQDADIGALLDDLVEPPIEQIGALSVEAYLTKRKRKELAAALNSLLASPTFATWREGQSLDVGAWLTPQAGRTPLTILSVAHLDDDDRALLLGVVMEEVLAWVRTLPGTDKLRALIVFDEVLGFLPPHPANPPSKRPLVALMKQARAYGVGMLIATQNPMDLDYRALSNAGLWWLGRLQTDADRARVVDGLSGTDAGADEIGEALKRLSPRWFVMRNVHATTPADGTKLLQVRQTVTIMKGPMTRAEIRAARTARREKG